MSKWIFDYGRAPADPEKMVLPSIVFCSPGHEAFKEYNAGGISLSFGWWDWYVRVAYFQFKDTPQ